MFVFLSIADIERKNKRFLVRKQSARLLKLLTTCPRGFVEESFSLETIFLFFHHRALSECVLSFRQNFVGRVVSIAFFCQLHLFAVKKFFCQKHFSQIIFGHWLQIYRSLSGISSVKLTTLIIYYIADLPVTRLRLLTNKSDNVAACSFAALIHRLVGFQLTSPLAYIIARSSSFAFFDSLLRSSWDARLTSRITNSQSQKNRLHFWIDARKRVYINPHLCENGIENKKM